MIETIGADPQDQAPPRPEGERRLTAGGCLIQVAGFIPPAIAAFVLTMMAFARYNPWPRDEMTQGIMGFWGLVFAVPAAFLAGGIGAVLAGHWADRRSKRVDEDPRDGDEDA